MALECFMIQGRLYSPNGCLTAVIRPTREEENPNQPREMDGSTGINNDPALGSGIFDATWFRTALSRMFEDGEHDAVD